MILKSVSEILEDRPVPSVVGSDTVRAACAVLAEFDIGAVVVLDGSRLIGVMSERDVVRRCVLEGRPSGETTVAEIMTPDPDAVTPSDSVAEALRHLISGGFRHLPVVDGETCVGLLSVRDIPTEYRMMLERFEEMRGSKPSVLES